MTSLFQTSSIRFIHIHECIIGYIMPDSDDSADIVSRVRDTVEEVAEEAENVGDTAQAEIAEALDELEQHVEDLRNQE